MSKYQRNAWKKFDCPMEGCDRIDNNGLKSAMAVGQHLRHQHNGSNGMSHKAHSPLPPPAMSIETAAPAHADRSAFLAIRLMKLNLDKEFTRAEMESAFKAIMETR